MDYIDNGSFMNELDTQNQIEKKSQLNTYLLIGLLITTSSTLYFYMKMEEYKEELARRMRLGYN